MIEANASLNEILLKIESQQILIPSSSKDVREIESESPNAKNVTRAKAGGSSVNVTTKVELDGKPTTTKSMTTTAAARKRVNQVIDRRRRRGQRLSNGSSDSEGEEGVGRIGDSSSNSSLSMPSDGESGEDIQVLESLSDSSGSDDERLQPPPQQRNSHQISSRATTNQASKQETMTMATDSTSSNPAAENGKPRASGRRQIVLAASFNLAPPSSSDPSLASDGNHNPASRASTDSPSQAQAKPEVVGDAGDGGDVGDSGDRLLKEVYSDAVKCSCVHTACSILAEDSYLTLIKIFADWLHTYSIVLAATSKQVSMHVKVNLFLDLNIL